jgi:hypothetical protein
MKGEVAMPSKILLSILTLTAFATFVSACSDRYRNPADDPRNQTTTYPVSIQQP